MWPNPQENADLVTFTEEILTNTGKYGPEKTPYLDTFHAVITSVFERGRAFFVSLSVPPL